MLRLLLLPRPWPFASSRVGGVRLRDLEGDRVLDLDLGEGERRGDRESLKGGEGALWTEVGVCALVGDRPRDGDLEGISKDQRNIVGKYLRLGHDL